jgi:hypothetical protein
MPSAIAPALNARDMATAATAATLKLNVFMKNPS